MSTPRVYVIHENPEWFPPLAAAFEAEGVPVEEILRRTADLLAQGAAGIVYGRNVIQHPDPKGMTRALMAVVHEGATPEAARGLVTE